MSKMSALSAAALAVGILTGCATLSPEERREAYAKEYERLASLPPAAPVMSPNRDVAACARFSCDLFSEVRPFMTAYVAKAETSLEYTGFMNDVRYCAEQEKSMKALGPDTVRATGVGYCTATVTEAKAHAIAVAEAQRNAIAEVMGLSLTSASALLAAAAAGIGLAAADKAVFCKYCGHKAASVKTLTANKCLRHPNGAFKGPHSLVDFKSYVAGLLAHGIELPAWPCDPLRKASAGRTR